VTEIRVAQGLYFPDRNGTAPSGSGERSATFQLINGVSLLGGFAGTTGPDPDERNVSEFVTTLSGHIGGSGSEDNSYHVTTGSLTDSTAVLDGFTITGGEANGEGTDNLGAGMLNELGGPTVVNCTFLSNSAKVFFYDEDEVLHCRGQGGAMWNSSSHTIIADCSFHGNTAASGGAIVNVDSNVSVTYSVFISNSSCLKGGAIYNDVSAAEVSHCTLADNRAGIDGYIWGYGAGMYNRDSSAMVIACSFVGNSATRRGGGMYVLGGSLTVTDSAFAENSADYAAGIQNESTSATFSGCTFSDNTAVGCGPSWCVGSGGGMLNGDSDVLVLDSRFDGNWGFSSGGGVSSFGGVVAVVGCAFETNRAQSGGAMYNRDCSPIVAKCKFSLNSATKEGGAMANDDASSPVISNSVFSDNSALEAGGALANRVWIVDGDPPRPTVICCTFSGNSADTYGGAIFNSGRCDDGDDCSGAEPTVINSILWGNTPDQIFSEAESWAVVRYSNLDAGWGGDGVGMNNISSDPLFVDPANGDLRLSPGSPCIDAGHNNAIADLTDTDLDGNPRFADDPATADSGCGVPVVVDMGAYEYQGEPAEVVDADLTGDGIVGLDDFDTLMDCWSSPDAPCCLADLDFDDSVGVTDFLILLANWG
jgi:predicted outer membrane repeat protein